MKGYEKFSHGKGQKFALWGMRIPLILSIIILVMASPGWPKEAFDMILNSKIYPYPSYSFKTHFRQSLQVKAIEDNRPNYERINNYDPGNYIDGSYWSEPIAVMVEKVLEREFLLSNLFDSVSRHDNRSSLLLETDLNSFSVGWIPGRSGLKSIHTIYAVVDLNASLITRRKGKILLIKNYQEETEAEITEFRDREVYAAIELGKALKRVTVSLMKDIKQGLERLETKPIKVKRGPIPIKKRPPRKQRVTRKPKKRTVPEKEPVHILKPIGPK